jgi:hypothetical protein
VARAVGECAVSDVDGVALSEDDLRCVLRAFACCVFACMRGGGWKALVLSSRCCCCRCPLSPCHHLAPSTLPPPPPGTRLSYALPMTSPSPPNARIEPIAYRRRPERNEYRKLQHTSGQPLFFLSSTCFSSRLLHPISSRYPTRIHSKTKESRFLYFTTLRIQFFPFFSFPFRRELFIYPRYTLRTVYAQSIHPVLPAFLSQPTVLQSTPTIHF